MMRRLGLSLAGLLMGCSSRTQGIYFIAFERQDIGSVTSEIIEERAEYSWRNAPKSIRQELTMMAECREGQRRFDDKSIRLKVEMNDSAFLVDSNGVASFHGRLCVANVSSLRAAIRGLQEPDDREKIRQFLSDAVGPYPWYINHLTSFEAGGKRFHWTGTRADTLKEVGVEKPLLVLNMYANAFAANPGYIGVFGKRNWQSGIDTFVLAIFDVANLKPIMSDKPSVDPARTGITVSAESEPVERLEIPNFLPAGVHPGFSSRFADKMPELLLRADGPQQSGSAATSIYIWRPRTGEIEVLPQSWFTGEFYDLGYQWITQVKRHPETHRIIGSGIRLHDFELDDAGTDLRRVFIFDNGDEIKR